MTLIKDLIHVPEHIHKGDYVLKLTEGLERAKETLRDYVVTPQLLDSFDQAIAFIRSAVDNRSSKAAYLHGSFGSGKSHFMAVLHLLLQNNPDARALVDLAPVVAKHDDWLQNKKLLMVPYHMIGATSIESTILGGYVRRVQQLHPQAAIPGVYLAEPLFLDAKNLRETMGDYGFFPLLNKGVRQDGDDWGKLANIWNPTTFDKAITAPPGDALRSKLVGDLVKGIFTSNATIAVGNEEAFVPLEEGLTIISRHAHELGYDGIILFLDELILWLASHVADLTFVTREIQKVIKLVESGQGGRTVPIISFVARQRDLRELVGEHMPGAQHLSFADTLKYWEGRFHTLTLEDRNLPVIAEKRVLRPKSPSARAQLQAAFDNAIKLQEGVLSILLTNDGDRETFRRVFPFSPALIQALVALSSVLQRERTALRVMLQLLVNQRETLELGQIVPVGDLYDVIAEEAEPFTSEMRHHFENAHRLYRQKLLPMLEKEHGISREYLDQLPTHDLKRRAFLTDDRLLKTLLLSALVPEVECFKGMNAGRLTELNHGTVRSPIPGKESGLVLLKCRKWAGQIGEIKIGEEPTNPTIAVQLSGVDIETILEKARSVDNHGSRFIKIRDILYRALGMTDTDSLFYHTYTFLWRGTSRTVEVLFANIRELTDDSLIANDNRWRVVIDFPFDVEGHTPNDDRATLERFSSRQPSTHTLCWLPSFFSRDVQRDLGSLVVMDHVLTSDDRFRSYTGHLSEVERASARTLMDNQRSQLNQHLLNCLEAAYGLSQAMPGTLDHALRLNEHFHSLDKGFQPRPPVASNLGQGFLHLLDQAFTSQFHAHPKFEAEIKIPNLRRIQEEVVKAVQTDDGRHLVLDKNTRTLMRQILNPLKLGEMYETHYLTGNYWLAHFDRFMTDDPTPLTVRKLREWCDNPLPMGLPTILQNLLIMTFAQQTNRVFMLHGASIKPTLENLPDEAILHLQDLPSAPDWQMAKDHAASIFGITISSKLCNATNVIKLAEEIQGMVKQYLEGCRKLAHALHQRGQVLSLPPNTDRKQTADSVLALLEKLKKANTTAIMTTLAHWTIPTTTHAMGVSMKQADGVIKTLEDTRWKLLETAWELDGESAKTNRDNVIDALSRDELSKPLKKALEEAENDAIQLLRPVPTPPPPPVITPVIPPPRWGRKTFLTLSKQGVGQVEAMKILGEINQQLAKHPHAELTITVRIEGEEEMP